MIIFFQMEIQEPIPVIGSAQEYTLHVQLGNGGQAVVYLASNCHKLYAAKVYKLDRHLEVIQQQAFRTQVNFLEEIQSPRLASMVDYYHNGLFKLENQLQQRRSMIILDLAQGGELMEYVQKQGRFPPQVCRFYAKQMIETLINFRLHDVAHRDIKPDNILFNRHFNIKMIDFGLSCKASGVLGDYIQNTLVGTEGYRPPQMEGMRYNSFQADIFAVGVVLFIMYKGNIPFKSTKPQDKVYRCIRDGNFYGFWKLHEKGKPEGFYEESFKSLINSFFNADPNKRPTLQSLTQNEWWNGQDLSPEQIKGYMSPKHEQVCKNSVVSKVIRHFKAKWKEMVSIQFDEDSTNGEIQIKN